MKIPYALTAAMTVPQRTAQMAHAVSLGLPRLQQVPIDDTKTMSIACYGPSLKHTWRDLTRPIMSMSGATKWLAERGVIPDYHVDMDPRKNKVSDVSPAYDGVKYLMASVCCPEVFALLKGKDVTLWHTYSGKDEATGEDTYGWVAKNDPGALVVHGGSTIGLTAIHLGGVLGYRHFEIHGMDGSFEGDDRHAGAHTGKAQPPSFTWAAEGVTYRTSQIMANAVAETINTMEHFPVFCVFHGDGLTQALLREADLRNACTARETEKVARVSAARPMFLQLPPVPHKQDGQSFWDALLAQESTGEALRHVMAVTKEADARRPLARYNTGTIPVETALLLRTFCLWYRPRTVVEVGTFIGTSTLSMAADRIFTCDRDNDCLPSSGAITTFPRQSSTQMLQALTDQGVTADLFFFDGRIQPEDVPLILRLSTPKTAFLFDDCTGREKGVANIAMLRSHLTGHALIPPHQAFKGRTTLAAILPMTSS